MARKRNITKKEKRKIAMRNLRKAWKANRKASRKSRKRSRRKNPRKLRRSKKAAKSRKRARSRKSRKSRLRLRRNSGQVGSVLRAGWCSPSMRYNPGLVDSVSEMDLDYAYTKPRRWNPGVTFTGGNAVRFDDDDTCSCDECPVHGDSRENPGWSFKGGQAVPHDKELSEMYKRSSRSPRRYNPNVLRADFCASPWPTTF